jgi:hypothetical protein
MKTINRNEKGDILGISESSENQSSLEVSRNAKGDYSWSLKIYSDDLETIDIRARDTISKVQLLISTLAEASK